MSDNEEKKPPKSQSKDAAAGSNESSIPGEDKNVARLPPERGVDNDEQDFADAKMPASSTSVPAVRPGAVAVGPDLTTPLTSSTPAPRGRSKPDPSASSATAQSMHTPMAAATTMSAVATAPESSGKESYSGSIRPSETVQPIVAAESERRDSSERDDGDETATNLYPAHAPEQPRESQAVEPDVEEEVSQRDNDASAETSSTLPVAQAYEQAHLISAELVAPPTEAQQVEVFHVDIDGDGNQQRGLSSHDGKKDKWRDQKRDRRLWLVPVAVIAVIIAAIAIFLDLDGEDDDYPKQLQPDEEPTASPTFPYPCYTSTLDLFTAQIEMGESLMADNPLIICPNTTIKVGVPENPSRDTWGYILGDFPIQIINRNVTIQCGLDGRRENNCTLDGGLVHVIAQWEHWHPEYGFTTPSETIDNLLIRGLTFTGRISGSGPFLGIGAVIGHPGKNLRYENCAWVNMTASHRLLAVGASHIMTLQGLGIPDLSVELTLSSCIFDNVSYNEEFLVSFNQIVHIENCQFRNIQFNDILHEDCSVHPEGCRNILHCRAGGPNVCSISNICIENFDVAGAGPIVISNDTAWIASGNNTWYGPLEASKFAQEGDLSTGDIPPFCALGVARLDENGNPFACLDSVFEQGLAGGCPGF